MAEFGMGLCVNIVTEIVNSISRTIKCQVLYVFKHTSYVNDLNEQVRQLNLKRERVEVDVDQARRQGDAIYEDVGKWVEDVNRFVEQEAGPFIKNEGQVGTCSLITRYKVGRKAMKAAKAGCSLLGKDFSGVSYRPAPQRTVSLYADRDYKAFDSRESILSKIMEALKDPHVNRIGVYGMGGVGKTTLVKKVARQAKQENSFDDVVMVEVTQKPDYKKIQEKITFRLGLEFRQDDSESERADRIRNRLKKGTQGKQVLVILDNIWSKPDLDAIGIPLENDHENGIAARGKGDSKGINDDQMHCKILVTSRSLDILRNYMKISENFYVRTLYAEEAQGLFWKIVDSEEKIGFRGVAEQIIKKCGGLPLAVATIANALKYKDLDVWEDALDKLKASNPRSIPEIDENLFSVIKLSFDLLNSDEAKSLLLLISLVEAGVGISHNDLMRYGMGLRLFKDIYTLEQGRNRVATLISDLKASCLLLEGDTSTWAKMHEVVHVVAASIASTNNFMFNIQDVSNINRVFEEISKNSTAISLPSGDIYELPERLECPKLELLFLLMESQPLTIPNNFFEGVKELKVITMEQINLQLVPSSFRYLTKLRTLCLNVCKLGDISIIGELTNLEILSFTGSNIERLPTEIGQLTRLQMLDLSECSSLTVIPANVISRLSRLEELDLEECFVEWEDGLSNRDGGNANLAELSQLSHLTTLRVCIPDAQIIPSDLFIQELKRFRILIGDVCNWSYNNEASKSLKLNLNKISHSGYIYGPIKRLLKIVDDLFLDELNDVQDVLHELDEEGFKNLKYLHVQNGPMLRYIVNVDGQIPCDAFLMLEALSLNNLVNLVKICNGSFKEASFNKLKVVKVNRCHELKHLFSVSMAKCLSHLQEIEVTDCKNLQAIFAEENDVSHAHDDSEPNCEIKFTQLNSLTLRFLPQFTSFCFNMETPLVCRTEIIVEDDPEVFKMIEFPCLEYLMLSSINIENISSVNTSCHTLRELVVQRCNGLKVLFSSSMVKSLMQLQELRISNCELMEEVIDSKGLEGEETISFPKLEYLWLEDLPNLKRFGTGNLVEFPLMTWLSLRGCPNMITFFSKSTCEIQPLFDEKVGLPYLEHLSVSRVDNMRKIWDDRLSSNSYYKLQSLFLLRCDNLLNIFPSSMLGRLHTLESLSVRYCDSLEEIFEFQPVSDQKPRATIAPQLRKIELGNLPQLKHIWNMNAQQILAFDNLIEIRVHYCKGLKSLFPAVIAKCLRNLEKLEIAYCNMNEIVGKQETATEEEIIPRFKFPRLSSLELFWMNNLETFYSKEHFSEWPTLKKMKVCHCYKIKILSSELQSHQESQLDHLQALFFLDKVTFPNLEELEVSGMDTLLHLLVGNSQPSTVFQNLQNLKVENCRRLKNLGPSTMSLCNVQTLEVSNCNKLINLVTLSTARSMVKITRMNIVHCQLIEEIITQEGDEAINNDVQIVFNELNYLRLEELPSLTSFCFRNYAIEFPELERPSLCRNKVECPSLESTTIEGDKFFSRNLSYINTSKTEEANELDLGDDLQHMFQEMTENIAEDDPKDSKILFGKSVAVPNLGKLVVLKCDNLKSLFPTSIANDLLQLKELEIVSCMVEEIVAEEEVVVAEKERIRKKLFPQLDQIILKDLPNMKRFCNFTGDLIELLSLSSLVIDNCPNMETFISNSISIDMKRNEQEEMNSEDRILAYTQPLFHEKVSLPNLERLEMWHMDTFRRIWEHDQVNLDSFNKLRVIVVNYCNQLLHIFPFIMHGRLQKLEELRVYNCKSLEEMLELEAFDDRDEIVFKKLRLLHLKCLRSLRGFYLGNCTLKLPSLDEISVQECSKMEIFSRGIVNSPKLQGVKLTGGEEEEKTDGEKEEDTKGEEEEETDREEEGETDREEEGEYEWFWEGDLNTTVQHIFKQMNAKTSEQD